MGPGVLDTVILSRLQFAFTALFHILWPVLIVGLSIFLLVLEILWLKTRKDVWYRQFRFWTKILLLNLAVGVVTGFPMEFQFGTNWSRFARAGGDVFGHLLGFEATTAFMLEASFLSIMVFGWKRSFCALSVVYSPHMIPSPDTPSVAVHALAAAPSSLMFMLIVSAVALPIIVGYTSYEYWVYRGKTTRDMAGLDESMGRHPPTGGL